MNQSSNISLKEIFTINKTFVCVLLIMSFFNLTISAQDEKEYPYDLSEKPKGNGTDIMPYEISNVYNLLWIAKNVNSGNELKNMHFLQTNDIDLSIAKDWCNGEGWMPIGGYFYYSGIMMKYGFKGLYDGDGFTIRNLYINRPDYEYQGLFGYVSSCEIANLHIDNAEVEGLENVGGLTAYAYMADIIGCSVKNCNIKATDFYVGGIAGYQDSGIITDCIVEGTISGKDYVGGIVSWINEGKVANCVTMGSVEGLRGEYSNARLTGGTACYTLRSEIDRCISMASVSGDEKVGGLIGAVSASKVTRSSVISPYVKGLIYVGGLVGENDNSIIEDCFARTMVTGSQDVGGLIGSSSYMDSRVTRCYAASEVIAEDESVMGGLIGIKSTGIVSSCYWDTNVTGDIDGVGGFYHEDIQCDGKTTAELKDKKTYVGWDFDKVWMIQEDFNDGYPILKESNYNILGIENIKYDENESIQILDGTLYVHSIVGILNIRIISVSGKILKNKVINGNDAIFNINALPVGIYIVKADMKNGECKTIKFKI